MSEDYLRRSLAKAMQEIGRLRYKNNRLRTSLDAAEAHYQSTLKEFSEAERKLETFIKDKKEKPELNGHVSSPNVISLGRIRDE